MKDAASVRGALEEPPQPRDLVDGGGRRQIPQEGPYVTIECRLAPSPGEGYVEGYEEVKQVKQLLVHRVCGGQPIEEEGPVCRVESDCDRVIVRETVVGPESEHEEDDYFP